MHEISADVWGGWVFVNPDHDAAPLAEFLSSVSELLDAYHPEEAVPMVLNIRQPLACNWKVVVEAFVESYHVHAIHPQILPTNDDVNIRHTLLGDHNVFVVPVAQPSPRLGELDTEEMVDGFLSLGAAFGGKELTDNPLEAVIAPFKNSDGEVDLPPGVSLRSLFADAVSKEGAEHGLDFSRLTTGQLTDSHAYFVFPNVLLIMRAGEFLYITATPDPDGDPNRCVWEVATYRLIADLGERARKRAPRNDVPEDFSLGLVLDQDREQMPRQQRGLRNRRLEHVISSKQEIRAAHFNRTLERYLGLAPGATAIR